VDRDPGRPRVCFRAPNWLGDAVMALPALADLRRSLPDVEVEVVAVPVARAVVSHLADPPPVVELPARETRGRLLLAGASALRRRRYAAGTILPPSFSSALLFALGGIPHRVGFTGEGRGILLHEAVAREERGHRHLAEEYRDLVARTVRRLGREPRRADDPVRLVAPGGAHASLDRVVGDVPRPWIVLAPGAVYGPTKRWPAERYGALADALVARHGGTVFLTGAAGDRDACAATGAAATAPTVDLAGKTGLPELVALLGRADLVVSNDSGAMHLAGATGAPLVAIFGSTNPAWTSPIGDRVTIVRRPVPCAPCYARTCAIGIVCLTGIEVDEAQAAADDRLRTGRALPRA